MNSIKIDIPQTDILYIQNVIYHNKTFYFNKSIPELNKFVRRYKITNFDNFKINQTINDYPVLFATPLDSCYSHMVLDKVFPIFSIISDIKNQFSEFTNFRIFFYEEEFIKYKRQCFKYICKQNNIYTGTWGKYFESISILPPIFEHNIDPSNTIFIKDCFFYILNDSWQRSPWNSGDYYPCRRISKNNTLYSDEIIYNHLKKFIQYFKNKYNIIPVNHTEKNIIIIERTNNQRRFSFNGDKEQIILNFLINLCKKTNANFNGVKHLENMTLEQQIKLYNDNNIIIYIHGSSLTNLIWLSNNSLAIEVEAIIGGKNAVINGRSYRSTISERLLKVTNSNITFLNHHIEDLKKIENIINIYK